MTRTKMEIALNAISSRRVGGEIDASARSSNFENSIKSGAKRVGVSRHGGSPRLGKKIYRSADKMEQGETLAAPRR